MDSIGKERWIPGVITSIQGNVLYLVKLESGRIRKCHTNQLRERHVEMPCPSPEIPPECVFPGAVSLEINTEEATEVSTTPPDPELTGAPEQNETDASNLSNPVKTYPNRSRRQVQRYDPSFK